MDLIAPIKSCLEIEPNEVPSASVAPIYAHWRRAAGQRWAPAWSDIDIMSLPAPLVPYILVCDVVDGDSFRYRYWGRGHTEYHDRDYTGCMLSEMTPLWVQNLIFHQYMRVLETKKPRLFMTEYDNIEQPMYSLRMPLSNDGETVTGIFGIAERRGLEKNLAQWLIQRRLTA